MGRERSHMKSVQHRDDGVEKGKLCDSVTQQMLMSGLVMLPLKTMPCAFNTDRIRGSA